MIKKTLYTKVVIIAIFCFILDQITKWAAQNYLKTPYVITDWLQFRYETNYGIAWSIPVPYPLLLILTTILICLVPYVMAKSLDLRFKITQVSLGLVMGGALGNLFDRFVRGFVVDFISVGWWPVFNLADSFLSIGIFLALLFYAKIKRSN